MRGLGGHVPIWAVVVGVGGVFVLVGAAANRYHSRRFTAHTDRLHRLSQAGETEAIPEAVEAFHEDRRVDLAIELMILEPVGFGILFMGVTFYLI